MNLSNRIWLAFLLAAGFVEAGAQQHIHVMTFNIRFSNPKDAPNDWDARKDKVMSQILFHEADVVGVQEALHSQVVEMEQGMPAYGRIGVGRDDGATQGEYSCIFYRKDRFEVQESNTFWLSLTPTVAGSKSWDAAITRVVTWARLRDKKNKQTFYIFNTHFDHVGKVARRESAAYLLRAVDSIAGKVPAVVTGDFNAHPHDEPIKVITDAANPLRLTDSQGLSATPHYGPQGTFNAFRNKETDNTPIDYIFLKGSQWQVLQHATLSQTWGGLFSSDHFPVFARLRLRK